MVDIFDEVEADLRAERTRSALMRYGAALAGLAMVAVLAVGGWQGWRWYQSRDSQKIAALYVAASQQAAAPGPAAQAAIAQFAQVAKSGGEGYRTLARLREAGLRAGAGDLPAALALWDQVAHDDAADAPLRDLATLMWVQRQVDHGDPAVLQSRLAGLTAPGGIWRPLALEDQALIQLRSGATAAGRATLRQLAGDVTAPQGVRTRAGELLARLGG